MATTTGTPPATLGTEQLHRRRAAWVDVMGGFVPGLALLEETVCRAAEAIRGRVPGKVLDLGGGPGLLAERMTRRWPRAEVTLLDLDPVLRRLAGEALPGVRTLDGDLSGSAWTERTGGDHDLVTAVMTVHYLTPERARTFYRDARHVLAPGGLLIVADLIPDDGVASLMDALDPADGEAAAELAWARWWDEAAGVAALRPLLAQRAAIFGQRPPAGFTAPASWHAAAARDAGFAEAGIVWRCGRHAALAAVG